MLDVLDPDSDSGRVYRVLVRRGRCTTDQLVGHTELPVAVVAWVLTELAALDVVVRLDGAADEWQAHSPGLVVAEVLRQEEVRRDRLWRAGAELDRLYHHARRDAQDEHGVQAVDGSLELIALTRRLQEQATGQIRWLDRPPYRSRPHHFREQEELQSRRMAEGLRYRTVYHQAVYDDPSLFASMTRMVELGEDARVLADLPVKLTVGDDSTALLVPDPAGDGATSALVVRTPGLVTALAAVFETLWTLGIPLTAGSTADTLSERDRAIVTLMAAGVTDDVIARRLRLSRRTVVRRIAVLLDRLGATTRFQAGVQAAHRGWL